MLVAQPCLTLCDPMNCMLLKLRLSWFTEKAVATHSSTLASKIPWAEEPGRLQYMGSQSGGHD